jgi:DNA invertase Pin-like site-specific DNA recombinase
MERNPAVKRCAIYCRKSVSMGLDKANNSLDTQRDICEKYIANRSGDGWVALPEHYDDGGFSGKDLERPAVKRLLADCEAGRVDQIVVYRFDRFARSIFAFAKTDEDLERWGVGFTSVTEQFDTSTPIGRLMKNFAIMTSQWERETIQLRLREKWAMTRERGKWIGGIVPFGYRVENHRLVPNGEEAEIVRWMYDRYLDCGSTVTLSREMEAKGWRKRSGGLWMPSDIARTLSKHLYYGKVFFRGAIHEGEHEGLVSEEAWTEVRRTMDQNKPAPGRRRIETTAPLRGILRCGVCGCAMQYTWYKNSSRRYGYYCCSKSKKSGTPECEIGRIPAGEVERTVFAQLGRILQSRTFAGMLAAAGGLSEEDIRGTLANLPRFWDELFPEEKRRLVQLLVERAELGRTGLDIVLRTAGCRELAKGLLQDDDDANA